MLPKVADVCKSYCSHPTERGAMELTAIEMDIIQHGVNYAIKKNKSLFLLFSGYKEDASQEAWCRICKMLPSYNPERMQLINWASMQAVFAIQDWLRSSPFSVVHFPRGGDVEKKPVVLRHDPPNSHEPPTQDPTEALIRLMDNATALALLHMVKLPDSERRTLDNIESFQSIRELGYYLGVSESRASQIVTSLSARAAKLLSCFRRES